MAVALILDGHVKSSLAAVRSLGRAGIPVAVGAPRPSAMSLYSRYTTSRFVYPDPTTDRSAFLVAVKAQAQRLRQQHGGPPVLYCFSDATHTAVATVLETFGETVLFPLPSRESYAVAFDKPKTAQLAARLGIKTIPTIPFAEINTLTYPAVIKPPQSVSWQAQHGVFKTATFVFSKETLQQQYQTLEKQTATPPLIQPLILGEEYGVEMVCNQGEVMALFMHQRIRSLSPTGGAAVVKQTAPLFEATEQMQAQSRAVVAALRWTGPIMIEWKLQRHSDVPFLMEINGRFWGSLPLPVAAGVDFPLYYFYLATGQADRAEPPAEIPDVRTRHFWADVSWLLRVWFDRTPLRSVLYPSRVKALWHFLIEPFRSRGDIWSSDDPNPAWYEFIDNVRRRL